MLTILVVEDSERLQPALVAGLNATGKAQVCQGCRRVIIVGLFYVE